MINSILAVPVMNLIVFIAAIIMYLVRRTCQQIIKFHPYADFDVVSILIDQSFIL